MSPTRRKDGPTAASGETSTCPWCSATVPATASTCPSCGAALRDSADGDVLGVTSIDPTAYSRLRRIKPRGNRLTKWLAGDEAGEDESGGTVAPPTDEVKREMLRLELEALNAEIEAKSQAAAANRDLPPEDAATDRGARPPKGSTPG